jgi:flagellar hook-associated protein 3 FlgL
MITNLDPTSELFLANVARVQDTLAEANRQLTSGKKVAAASDAPDQIGALLQLRAALQHNTQIRSNLTLAASDADAADGALAGAIKLMDRALTLASQGTGASQTAGTLNTLALEIQGIQEQMVEASQTAVQGRFIFSGDQSDQVPYTFDITSTNHAVVQGTTASATSRVEDPAGGSFSAGKTAQEIFDPRNADGTAASGNVFAALNNLRLALLSGDTAAIANSIAPLKEATQHLNSMQSFYGAVQNRIQSASDYGSAADTRLRTQISQIEDADIAAAAMAMTAATTQLEAAFQMQGRMPHTSLFNYLG